jgi:hypothetical protein
MLPLIAPPRAALTGILLAGLVAGCGAGSTAPISAPAPAGSGTSAGSEGAKASRAFLVAESEGFARAVAAGTRTRSGEPGPRYWQQWAEYRLEGELNPLAKRLTGRGTVKYSNRSPDTLPVLYVQTYNNLFSPDTRKNTEVPAALGGMEFSRVAAQGKTLGAGESESVPGYRVDGTVMRIRLPQPLAPGATADLEFAWSYRVPPDGAPRGGQDGEVYYLAYWYPQMAVYDDVNGWQIDQYLGNAEFYMGYADYDVALTVPAGWLVGATGTLQNGAEVLSAQTRARLDSAAHASGIVRVVGDADRGAGRATAGKEGGKLTWRFRAKNVRDFDWGTSAKYLWDATSAATGDHNGDGRADTAAIYAFWRPEKRSSQWQESARYGRHSIEFLSKYLWPYPYPHMTMMDGPESCGGMEYPMMTCIGGQWDTLGIYEVTTHEIAHMWFPMQVGSDEKRFSWMDEGLTQFNQSQAMADFFKGFDDEARNRDQFLNYARNANETELMRHGDRYPSYNAFGVASYYKPAAVLDALRAVLGPDVFNRAFREYGRRWSGKHPQPYDLWNTFENVSGRDLDWFWRSWFIETWKLDQAIDTVIVGADSMDVVIENRGRVPMPVLLSVTRGESGRQMIVVPVDVWLGGARRHTVRVARSPAVTAIQIDPDRDFPDVERDNQTWPQ